MECAAPTEYTSHTTFMCIGDPHIRRETYRYFYKAKDGYMKIMHDLRPDIVIVMGDVLNDHADSKIDTQHVAIDWFEEMASLAPIYVLCGNHDLDNPHETTIGSSPSWMRRAKRLIERIPNVYVCVDPMLITVNGRMYTLAPYTKEGNLVSMLNECVNGWTDSVCVFCHQEFLGCKLGSGGYISSIGDDVSQYEHITFISGHIHTPQLVGDNVVYTGSMYEVPHDGGQKLILSVKISDDGTLSTKWLRIPGTIRFRRPSLNIKDIIIEPQILKDCIKKMSVNNNEDYRITLKGTRDEINVLKQKNLLSGYNYRFKCIESKKDHSIDTINVCKPIHEEVREQFTAANIMHVYDMLYIDSI